MSTTPAKAAKKGSKASKTSLKGLITRTQTIADKVTMLLGELRRLDKQGLVITKAQSGPIKKENPI